MIAAASKSGYSFAKKKAGLLISAAQKAQTLGIHSCADETLIVCTIQMLRTLSESVLQIETAIDNLLAQIKDVYKRQITKCSPPDMKKPLSLSTQRLWIMIIISG